MSLRPVEQMTVSALHPLAQGAVRVLCLGAERKDCALVVTCMPYGSSRFERRRLDLGSNPAMLTDRPLTESSMVFGCWTCFPKKSSRGRHSVPESIHRH